MKSAMPYHGVTMPVLRRLIGPVFEAHPLDGFDAWRDAALGIHRHARFREERYAPIELTGLRRYRDHHVLAALPMYEEMIVTGAWWDLVDGVATDRLGSLLRAHRRRMSAEMRRWSRDPDMWKRRSSIICQVALKAETDTDLLYDCIGPNLADRDFFIRKAIGWALRQYAWTAPDEVRRYVAGEPGLSPLSRREALKNVGV